MAVPKVAPVHVTIGDVWLDVSIAESHGAGAEVTEHPVEIGSNVADHVRPLPRTITIDGIVTNHPLELPLSHAGSARISGASVPISAAPMGGNPRVSPDSVQIEGEPSVGLVGAIPGVDQGVAILGALGIKVGSKVKLAAEQHNVDPRARQEFAATVVHFTEPFDRVSAVHEALLQIVDTSQLVRIVTGLTVYDSVALTDLSIERSASIGGDVLKFSAVGRVLRLVKSQHAELPDPVNARGKPGKSNGKQAAPEVPLAETPPSAKAAISGFKKGLDGFVKWFDS